MKILALELSSARGSIAFTASASEQFHAEFANDRKHSGAFFQQLDICIVRCGWPDRIVVGLGPGSYAGTRIAIATANGLRAATGAELHGIPSVSALATDAAEYVVIGDARRQSFYFADVRSGQCVAGPLLCSEADSRERIDGNLAPVFTTEELPAFPQARIAYPSALRLARLAEDVRILPAANLEPIYLRDPHITRAKATALAPAVGRRA